MKAETLKPGDTFTVAVVNAINPLAAKWYNLHCSYCEKFLCFVGSPLKQSATCDRCAVMPGCDARSIPFATLTAAPATSPLTPADRET